MTRRKEQQHGEQVERHIEVKRRVGKNSSSPQAIRHGNADPTDVDDSPVTSETDDLGYDDNPRKPYGTDPWAPSH